MHELDKPGEKSNGMGFWEPVGTVLVMAGTVFLFSELVYFLAHWEFMPWN